jgi:hypothetical protein
MRIHKSFVCIVLWSAGATANETEPRPVPREGACPSGYWTSGDYCMPGPTAAYAIRREGSCPTGYSSSGQYCLAGPNAEFAIPRSGACPSGYSTSGNYCLGKH